MTTDGVDSLDDLAAKVDDEFASHRGSDEFKTISLVIETSSSEWCVNRGLVGFRSA